jgi:N-acetylneuraminic acid mutarotase
MVVVGGWNGFHNLKSVAVLDLTTMVWSAGPQMLEMRTGCAAVVVESGTKMVVVGGWNGLTNLKSMAVLDLTTMRWSVGPAMQEKRAVCAAATVDGGTKMVVVGGMDEFNSTLKSVEVLDLTTMCWSTGPAMRQKRSCCTAIAVNSGSKMIVMGGMNKITSGRFVHMLVGATTLKSVEVLDLTTMSWSTGPSMRMKRVGFSAALVYRGTKMVVVGGANRLGTATKSTEVLRMEVSQTLKTKGVTTG